MRTARSWDSYRETLFEVLDKFQPKRVLEFGTGKSTDTFATYPSVLRLCSVEHDKEYYEIAKTRLYQNVSIKLEQNIDTYAFYKGTEKKYDLIFVDGRNRVRCIKESKSVLEDSGLVMLHDAEREIYKAAFDCYKYKHFTDLGSTVCMTDKEETYGILRSINL